MGTRFQTTACPLCADEFEDPVDFRQHLAFMHDLEDDEGAETTLEEVPPEPPAPIVVPHLERVAPVPVVAPVVAATPTVDRRLLPGLVVAVALQLAVALLGLAIVDGGGADKVTTAAGSSHAGTPVAGAATDDAASAAASAAAPATTAPRTTVAPTADTKGDQARADGFALRAGDFPVGWKEIDPAALEGDNGSGDSAGECTVPNDPTETDALTGQTASAFAHEQSFAFGGTMVLATENDALRTMSVIREVTPCLGDSMVAGAREGAPASVNITQGAFSSLGFPSYGDESIASTMPVTVSGPGGRVPLRVDVLAVRRDRAVAFVVVITGANDFTPQQERGTLSAIADRMSPRAI